MDHFHRFHDDQQATRLDPLTRRDLDGSDETRKWRDEISRFLARLRFACRGQRLTRDDREPPMTPAARNPDVVAVEIDRTAKERAVDLHAEFPFLRPPGLREQR